MLMSITPEEIIFVGLFVQIKSITVLEFSVTLVGDLMMLRGLVGDLMMR